MEEIVLAVSEEMADYWRALARESGVPLEEWICWNCGFVSVLGIPIRDALLGQAPLERELSGVAWEVRRHDSVEPMNGCGVLDNTVPIIDVRTGVRRKRMVNKVILIGHLGRDPEVRSTTSNKTVANLSIATNRRWRDAEGERQEATEWHHVVVFGRQAEVASQYLTCGRQVYVEGRLQTRSWEDRETGETRYRTEIVCENFQMLGQRERASGDEAPASGWEESGIENDEG